MKNLFTAFVLFLILIELSLISISIFCDFDEEKEIPESFFLDIDNSWADTLLKSMTLDEKIGQLFMLELIDAQSESKNLTDSVIQQYSIGGVKYQRTEVLNQLILTNYLQAKSKYPLMIGSEGTIINRKDFVLPIGPIINSHKDPHFTNFYLDNFSEVAFLEGINIEFSNSFNKLDSLQLKKGFSDNDSIQVKELNSFRKKLQSKKVISCLNFDDNLFYSNDSILTDSLKTLRSKYGISKFFAVQTSTEITDFIISKPGRFTLAYFLEQNYKYKGLIYSNVTDTVSSEALSILFNSGLDAFIVQGEIGNAISSFKSLVTKGIIKEIDINKKVKRILLAKSWIGLEHYEFKSAENSLSKILGHQRMLLSWKLYENSLCLLKNQNNLLPFSNLLGTKTHLLVIGKNKMPVLEEYLANYMDISSSQYLNGELKTSTFSAYSNIILAINNIDSINIKDSLFISVLKKIKQQKNLIILNFGNPQLLEKLKFAQVVIYTYDNHPLSQIIAANVIAGSISPNGQIPAFYKRGYATNVPYQKIDRLEYTIPEAAGFKTYVLEKIDKLIQTAISSHASPGCQILAAKDGKVFYNKSFGSHTYANYKAVKNSDIYDIASISKVAATTFASMKLYEEGKIHLNDSIKYYIEDTINCTIKNHQLKDFFLHQSGLQADMPILKYIRYRSKTIKRFDKYYSEKQDTSYSIKVADKFFLRKDYVDSVVLSLYNLEWDSTKAYNYSDINFNLIYDVISRKIKGKYTDYLSTNFYNPLQLRTMGFLPLERFSKSRIVPTQDDKFWRKQLLCGYPHDESAALYGGVSGNAGLFTNANDLAILFQMLLNGGTYAGKKILNKETIELFTAPEGDTRRGLGFAISRNGSFGHTGFTGCVVWANPESRVIFVFLSNSINPNVMNKKLRKMEIREKAYELIMQAYEPGGGVLKIGE